MNTTTEYQSLDARLSNIEKSAKYWRRVAISLAAVIGFGIMAGQASRQFDSRSLLEEIVGQPKVVGIAPIVGRGTQSGDPATTIGLVRVWSDGSTEMMGGADDEVTRLFRLFNIVDGYKVPRGFDSQTEQWWPQFYLNDTSGTVIPHMYWRPFVNENLSQP